MKFWVITAVHCESERVVVLGVKRSEEEGKKVYSTAMQDEQFYRVKIQTVEEKNDA